MKTAMPIPSLHRSMGAPAKPAPYKKEMKADDKKRPMKGLRR